MYATVFFRQSIGVEFAHVATRWDIFRLVFGRHLPLSRNDKLFDTTNSDGEGKLVTLKGEEVASQEECIIANWLFYNGVDYQYERAYEHSTATSEHRQYTEISGASELVTDTGVASGSPSSSESSAKAESDLVVRIEETIVQQLLYAVPAKTLPKTRLKRIDQASGLKIWWKTLCYGLLILAALRLYVPVADKLPKIEPAWLLEWLLWIPSPLAVGIAALGCIHLLHTCLRLSSLFSIDGLATTVEHR